MMTDEALDRVAVEMTEEIGEIIIADYLVFLFALDTYMRWVEELVDVSEDADESGLDQVTTRGLSLLRTADRVALAELNKQFRDASLQPVQLKMLDVALRQRPSARGAALRALRLRSILTRSMAATTRAIFGQVAAARKRVLEAIEASLSKNADEALTKLAAINLRNTKLEAWIDLASKTAGSGLVPLNPIDAASKVVDDAKEVLNQASVAHEAANPATDEAQKQTAKREEALTNIETSAADAARKAIAKSGQEDRPVTKSEAVGIATAAVAATARDVPESLRGLDPEQLAAATTMGRVLVAAGAGSGKTSTLVKRLAWLVQSKKVNPSRIMAVTFNTKAAREIKERLAAAVGDDAVRSMSIGTMHSIFRGYIKQYGTEEEKAALTTWMMEGGRESGQARRAPSPAAMGGSMARAWKECKGEDPPRKASNRIQKWQMNDLTPQQVVAKYGPSREAEWYEWNLGYRGVIKGWTPPCSSSFKAMKEWNGFLAKYRDGGRARLGTFSDMIIMFRDLLKRNPALRRKIQSDFDHINVDEAQDLNEVQHQIFDMLTEHITADAKDKSAFLIGDEVQCVHVDTPISVAGGTVLAKDLKDGDNVLSYRNGQVTPQTVTVKPSAWTWGYKVTTESGKTLTMSPNHRIWVSEINPDIEAELVYLMYRADLGFRVGTTANGRTDSGRRTCVNRMVLENADKIWILKVCSNHEEALLEEASYSLTYGIPTAVFNGYWRDLNQDRLDELFRRFGQNGRKLLADLYLDENLPHWTAYAATRKAAQRRVIQMVAHGKSSLVTFEWSGSDLHEKIGDLVQIDKAKLDDRYRIRKYPSSYREALAFALDLQKRTGALLNRRLSVPGESPYQLVNASGVFAGMRVVVQSDDNSAEVQTEEVVSVDKVEGTFLDLDVDDASNFFGGGILSHNSINSFVGARPDLFTGVAKKEGYQVKNIATNYRSLPEIIEMANRMMENHPRGLPVEARPDPSKPRGVASIVLSEPLDHTQGAIDTIEEIAQAVAAGGDISDHAVLTRTNAEINDFETACIMKGLPYARRGSSSFIRARETVTVMSYINLAVGQDFEKMQRALAAIFNTPNRFFLRAGESERIVDSVITKRARSLGVSKNQVNPLDTFDDNGIRDYLDTMDPDRRWERWKVQATREQLEAFGRSLYGLRDLVSAGVLVNDDGSSRPYKTDDLIKDILNIPGVPERGKEPPTLREVLMGVPGSQEEEGDNPEEDSSQPPIGNVAFLFQICQSKPGASDDPGKPENFLAKVSQLAEKSKDLRVNLDEWDQEQQKLDPSERKPAPCVVLSTIHSCKGAQWPDVTVVMADGVFPFFATLAGAKIEPDDPHPGDQELRNEFLTERQLAYVGFTRAGKNLTVLSPKVNAYGKQAKDTPLFVQEAGLTAGQNVPGKNNPMPDGAASSASVDAPVGSDEDYPGEYPEDMGRTAAHYDTF